MLGEMSSGEMSFWEKCHRGETCPREKCYTGRKVVGRNVAGRNVIGEKNLWGETSWNLLINVLVCRVQCMDGLMMKILVMTVAKITFEMTMPGSKYEWMGQVT